MSRQFPFRNTVWMTLIVAAALIAWLGLRDEKSNRAPKLRSNTGKSPVEENRRATASSTSKEQDITISGLNQKITETTRRLGAEHRRTLEWRTKRGQWFHSQGRHAEAEAEHRAVLAIRTRVLGLDHPDTLKSRKFLAAAEFAQGKYTDARKDYEAILATRWPDGGTDYPGWLGTWVGAIGVWYPKGLPTESAEAYASARDSMARTLFLDYPETTVLLAPRDVVLDHLGRLVEAERAYREGAEPKYLGAEHPDTLRARHFVDSALNGMFRYAEVEANERDILAIQERVLGPDHEDVLATRVFLATSLRDQEKFEEARAEAAVALEGFQRLRGPEDPATKVVKALLEDINAPH